MQLGVVGLGTMGANLARNAARQGAVVAIYNRTQERTDAFLKVHKADGMFIPCKSYAYLAAALKPPRAILIMVQAGEAVDHVISELTPLLTKDDILIDGGNSHYRDTERRGKALAAKKIHFLGMGVSGGEKGALLGPSIMVGGSREAYDHMEPLLLKMAATIDGATKNQESRIKNLKCAAFLGPGGAGHFVKMVHNGIEYGLMQLIAEAYDLLKTEGMGNAELADTFAAWNTGDLQSFLLEITASIFRTGDPTTGRGLIDVIKDTAGQKGTGQWTLDAAMHYTCPIPTITAAVDARILSTCVGCRAGWRAVPADVVEEAAPHDWSDHVRDALALSSLTTYLQGFTLLAYAQEEEKWAVNLSEVARIWRGGCIIRSSLLATLQKAYGAGATMERGVAAIRERFGGTAQRAWRTTLAHALRCGIPTPTMSASLAFYDSMRRERLPQNLTAAQRDFFGAHGYERIDKPGTFHTEWE